MRRGRLILGALVLLTLANGASVLAQEADCGIDISPARLAAGGSVTASPLGFAGDAELILTVIAPDGRETETRPRTDADGNLSVSLRLDRPGRYTIRFVLPESECAAEGQVTVTGVPDTATSDPTQTSRPIDFALLASVASLMVVIAGIGVLRRSRDAR
jgi:hypothetical protein